MGLRNLPLWKKRRIQRRPPRLVWESNLRLPYLHELLRWRNILYLEKDRMLCLMLSISDVDRAIYRNHLDHLAFYENQVHHCLLDQMTLVDQVLRVMDPILNRLHHDLL
jgi:hypothetical protein